MSVNIVQNQQLKPIGDKVPIDTQLSTTSENAISNKAVTEEITRINSDLTNIGNNKQDKTDNALETTAKTIVGAINEHESDISQINSGLTIKVGTISSWNEWLTSPYGSVKQYGKLKVLDLTFVATNPLQSMWHKICVTSIKPSQEVKVSATGLNGSLDARWLPNGEVQFFTFPDQLEHHLHIYGIVIE